MISLNLFPAMGATESSRFYETGPAQILSRTTTEIRLRAEILSGDFEDRFEVITLTGQFNPNTDRGMIKRWDSSVGGQPHYRLTFDDPIRLQSLSEDLAAAANTGVRFVGNAFANTFDGDHGNDILRGGGGNDRLRGLNGNDRLFGEAGNDILAGGNGHDRLVGGPGNDGLAGGPGNDFLSGGPGRDLLVGGPGADILVGGGGADLFRFTARADSRPGPAGRDTIRDFTSGVDRIDLSAIDARPNTPANDAFDFIGGAAFSGRPGEVRVAGQFLEINLNATPAPEMRIVLAGGAQVLETDLIL